MPAIGQLIKPKEAIPDSIDPKALQPRRCGFSPSSSKGFTHQLPA